MKVSLNWLRELVALEDRDAATVAAVLTRQGLEVEGIESRGRELGGVVIAEVLAVRPHPGAEKLRLVRVRAGSREEEVVCGAPNVPPPGNRVVWAAPGAHLPGGRTIEPREIRGVLSPGMLCSEPELGLGTQGDGILILSPTAPSGAELAAHLGLADDILEVNVTPNRPDALSHLGIARELAAGLRLPLRLPPLDEVPRREGAAPVDVQIADPQACPRYQARVITGLTVAPSPLAMRLRLESCGMRAISNLVDVTNYVLLETGHPLHAFDLAKVTGPIRVRRATAGERLLTLDGQERTLVAEDIVIADARGAVALAGVMGGASSEVSAGTRDVLLEAATFDPPSVRRTARRLGLHSEASYRFERGVDAQGVPYAAARAAALLARLGGGAVLDGAVDRYPGPAAPRRVTLTMKRLARVSGLPHTADEAAERLRRLGFQSELVGEGSAIEATVPSFRPDVAIEEDLIEEVMRMGEYGAPATKRLVGNARSEPNAQAPADRARDILAALGLSEIVTWGFVSRAVLQAISERDGTRDPALGEGVLVKNPLSSDYEVMRTSLLPGLADTLRRNLSRGVADPRLFEVGPIVRRPADPAQPPAEPLVAAGLLAGRAPGWLKPGEPLDFFDAKRVVEGLLRGFGAGEASYLAPAPLPFLHPGVSAEVRLPGGAPVGAVGELDPRVARRLGLEPRVLYFELALERLAQARQPGKPVIPPRFPAATRDLSFWVDATVSAAQQRAALLASGEPLLRSVAVLEDYRDPRHVPPGKKGMLWTMTYRADDRTLTDPEADAAHARVVGGLTEQLTIQIR
jgi:phenylalanyl-tRNA synthetase beta chain